MNRRLAPLGLATAFFAVASACLPALCEEAPRWQRLYATRTPATQALRGYGRVTVEQEAFTSTAAGGGRAGVVHFACQDPQRAATLLGKFLADLTLSEGVRQVKLTVGGKEVPAVTCPGGAVFVGCLDGAEARVVFADSSASLADFAAGRPAAIAQAVAAATYPTFLDRFDRYGWGLYGLGGFNNFHDWMTHAGDAKVPKDPTEDLAFLAANHFRFEPWLDPAAFDTSDGIIKNTESEWMVPESARAGLPVSFRVYADAGGADWTARRFAEYVEQPAKFLMSGWHGADQFNKSCPHLTWFDPDIHRYQAVKTMAMMRQFAGEPSVMGWMHPHGELAHDEWFDMHDDYSPTAHRNWWAFLREQGVLLADATRMYGRADRPFADWQQVPVPEFATFAGLGGQVLSLAGAWQFRGENDGLAQRDDAWWALPPEGKYAGLRERWWTGPVDAKAWRDINLPGNDELFRLFPQNSRNEASTWFRRQFQLTADQKDHQRIYLYWFPVSFGGIHAGPHKRFHGVYLNGRQVGEVGQWGALDVTDSLRAGDNEIALHLMGTRWNGRIFLSTEAPRVYPYLGKETNRLWLLWKDWHLQAKFHAWRDVLDGMRQVDGERPIKFMAPDGFGADRWLALASRYGAFGHFTGEGIWFFPWYKRYGFLYGLPGTSETAGPANNVDEQFDAYRRTFLAGLNGHDAVFLAQTYTRDPKLRKFWLDHAEVLHRMGKYDLAGPQVLLYRSTSQTTGLTAPTPYPELGQATREIQNPWNWDIGRGTLQTLGQSYLYLDDGGLADGKMAGYKLMIDSGNETVSPESLEHIAAWVRAGGTFVTLPFSGRNAPLEPDTWPISTLTGCRVGALRKVGQGTVTVKGGQGLLKRHAGKTFPDAGVSVDCNGSNHNLLSVELEPGEGCEVLATFDNGKPAIVRRTLGKGSVIAMGTAFWRNSTDRRGIWWPEPIETDFIADLLDGVGFDPAACTSDDRLVWAQPYRTNNGLDATAVLVSWNEDKDADVTLRLRLPRKPSRLVCYGVDGVKPLAMEWADGVATAKVPMPAREVKVVHADAYGQAAAIDHWWDYQQRLWHELAEPVIDFAPYTQGKWADPTMDLRAAARMTGRAPEGAGWLQPGFDDSAWRPCRLGILNFDGAEPGQAVWVRKTFTPPADWLRRGGTVYLINGAWSGPHYEGTARVYLNGTLLQDFTAGGGYADYDVTRLLNAGANTLAYEFRGGSKYVGFVGNVYLYHAAAPERSIDLASVWTGRDAAKKATLALPGKGQLRRPERTVFIPEDWRGRYRVRLHMEGQRDSVLGAWVNGRLVRRFHHGHGERCDVDITDVLRFGQDNDLVLAHGNEWNGPDRKDDNIPSWDLRIIRLDLHKAE